MVVLPGFGRGVGLAGWSGRAVVPGVPGCAPAPTAPGRAPFRRWGGSCWSGGCGQGAEPLPAGEERVLPGPVGADHEDPLAGVTGEAGWDMPDPVAERVRVGVSQVRVVPAAEEAGPGGQVGGDVRGDDPAAVDLPGLRREVPQAHGLGGADAACLHDGVLAVDGVDVLRVVAAGDACDSAAGDVRAGNG